MTETIQYPLPAFHFSVTFSGLPGMLPAIDSQFAEVSGLLAELAVEELEEGGENRFVHKLPGRARHPNLVLKRGLFPIASTLSDWAWRAINNLDIQPCNVLVTLLNELHTPVKSWNFSNVYPVKLLVSEFNANNNSLVIETMELAYDHFRELTI